MLPKHLVAQYWIRVRQLLEQEHHIDAEEALRGIADYRRALAVHGAHEVVYHDGESETAKVVAALLKPGQKIGR